MEGSQVEGLFGALHLFWLVTCYTFSFLNQLGQTLFCKLRPMAEDSSSWDRIFLHIHSPFPPELFIAFLLWGCKPAAARLLLAARACGRTAEEAAAHHGL